MHRTCDDGCNDECTTQHATQLFQPPRKSKGNGSRHASSTFGTLPFRSWWKCTACSPQIAETMQWYFDCCQFESFQRRKYLDDKCSTKTNNVHRKILQINHAKHSRAKYQTWELLLSVPLPVPSPLGIPVPSVRIAPLPFGRTAVIIRTIGRPSRVAWLPIASSTLLSLSFVLAFALALALSLSFLRVRIVTGRWRGLIGLKLLVGGSNESRSWNSTARPGDWRHFTVANHTCCLAVLWCVVQPLRLRKWDQLPCELPFHWLFWHEFMASPTDNDRQRVPPCFDEFDHQNRKLARSEKHTPMNHEGFSLQRKWCWRIPSDLWNEDQLCSQEHAFTVNLFFGPFPPVGAMQFAILVKNTRASGVRFWEAQLKKKKQSLSNLSTTSLKPLLTTPLR